MLQDFTQVYQLPASYMVKGGVISVVVDIPMVPTVTLGSLLCLSTTLFRLFSMGE